MGGLEHGIKSGAQSEHADRTVLGEVSAKGFEKARVSSHLPCVGSSAASQQTEGLLLQHLGPALLWFINIHCPSLGKEDISPPR